MFVQPVIFFAFIYKVVLLKNDLHQSTIHFFGFKRPNIRGRTDKIRNLKNTDFFLLETFDVVYT